MVVIAIGVGWLVLVLGAVALGFSSPEVRARLYGEHK